MSWRRKWQPTPVFLPRESQGRGSLVGCRLWGRTESDTTEATQQQHSGSAGCAGSPLLHGLESTRGEQGLLSSCKLQPSHCNAYVLSRCSNVPLFATPWTQPTSLLCPWDFCRREYWNSLPCPPSEDLPDPGVELSFLTSLALAGRFSTTCSGFSCCKAQALGYTDFSSCSTWAQ